VLGVALPVKNPAVWGCRTNGIGAPPRSQTIFPFVVRYLTMNKKSDSDRGLSPFAPRYRRVNGNQILLIRKTLIAFLQISEFGVK